MLSPLARILGSPLARETAPSRRADAIVVLGSPTGSGPDLAPVAQERVTIGANLYERGLAPIVCITGHRREAERMGAVARASGVPPHALRLEGNARNTRENAFFSAALLANDGCRTAWVVTQPFHLRRACYWFRRAGLVPMPWLEPSSIQYRHPDKALVWIAREYASWLNLAAREVAHSWKRNALPSSSRSSPIREDDSVNR